MKWIGLTGGIATGKSTVKKLIEGLGYPVIDADLISHLVTQNGEFGYEKVVSQFGNSVLNPDGTLNRKSLGQIVFNDSEKRLQLESILHPLIQLEVMKQKKTHAQNNVSLCFYDVPLLFEKNLEKNFDRVILVWCDPQIQKLRLATRNHLTEDEVQSRLSAQTEMAFKIRNADHCIDNSTDIAALDKQVQCLVRTLV